MKTRPTRFYSKRQEKSVAKAVSGKVVANSGATAFNKGDVTADNMLIECKTCVEEKKSFSIKREWLEKNKEEAFEMGKEYSALAFNYGPDTNNYYVIDEKLFKVLIDRIAVATWEKVEGTQDSYRCTNCNYELVSEEEDLDDFSYCPDCGRRIERR